MKKIIKNKARCLNCGAEIESKFRHDFQMCPCGSIYVDGGTDYCRRGGDPKLFEDLSESEDLSEDAG